jgi:hypothetical protein
LPTEKDKEESIFGFGIIRRPRVRRDMETRYGRRETAAEERHEEHEKKEGIIGEFLERRKR